MAFKILTNQRISALIEKLAPRFLGRDQDHLVAFADEIADASYDATVDYVEPLFDFRDDIQSPAGAAMVGILDAGGLAHAGLPISSGVHGTQSAGPGPVRRR